jgi:hypothetical protein
MAETIEQAKENDPKLLRARIAELEKAAAQGQVEPARNPVRIEVPVFNRELFAGIKQQIGKSHARIEQLVEQASAVLQQAHEAVVQNHSYYEELERYGDVMQQQAKESLQKVKTPSAAPTKIPKVISAVTRAEVDGGSNPKALPPGELKTLRAIATAKDGATLAFIVLVTGYRAGSIKSYTNRLSTRALVTRDHGRFFATPEGLTAAPSASLPSGKKLAEYYLKTLPPGEAQVLRIIFEHYPRQLTLEDITEHSVDLAAGSVKSYVGRLRTREIVERRGEHVLLAAGIRP